MPTSTIYVRVPPLLKKAIKAAAKREGLSVNVWAQRHFEEMLRFIER